MRQVTILNYKGREFVVVKFTGENGDTCFGTIDTNYIVDDKTTKPMNGLEMGVSASLGEAIESRKLTIDCDELIKSGMTVDEAIITITKRMKGGSENP